MSAAALMPPSLWAATAADGPPLSVLAGRHDVDVAIVGGGFTGLSAALHLAEQGVDVAVLEAHQPGWGASGRNGGQVVPLWKRDLPEMEKAYGFDRTRRLVDLCAQSADLVYDLIDKHAIDCDAVRRGWIQAASTPNHLPAIEQRATDWQNYGADVAFLQRDEVVRQFGSEHYLGGMLVRRGGHLHPLKYARGLARAAKKAGAGLFHASPVTQIARTGRRWRLTTPSGEVGTDTVLLCTNGYSDRLWPGVRESVVPVRSALVATAPLGENLRRTILPDDQAGVDYRRSIYYFRKSADGRLLFGGRGGLIGATPSGIFSGLQRTAERQFPQLATTNWDYRWDGMIAMTTHGLPHLVSGAPGLYAGLGFNGRGVAMATLLGKLLAERANGNTTDDLLPNPTLRPIPAHRLHLIGVAATVTWYKLLDHLDEARARWSGA